MPGSRQGLCALATGDRVDPHPPGSAGQGATALASPWVAAASGLSRPEILQPPRFRRAGAKAAEIGCARSFAEPRLGAASSGKTPGQPLRRTHFEAAIGLQRAKAEPNDRIGGSSVAQRRRSGKKPAFEKPILTTRRNCGAQATFVPASSRLAFSPRNCGTQRSVRPQIG